MIHSTSHLLRTTESPRLDAKALTVNVRVIYKSRCAALEAYASGERIEAIEKDHDVSRSTLARMAKRAQRAHADGCVWGYRTLVLFARLKYYEWTPRTGVLGRGYRVRTPAHGEAVPLLPYPQH